MPKLADRIQFLLFRRRHLLQDGVYTARSAYCCPFTQLEPPSRVGANSKLTKSRVGRISYISDRCRFDRTRIGRFCSIGSEVESVIGTHPLDYASTNPAFFSDRRQAGYSFTQRVSFPEYGTRAFDNYLISIGSDVWIGNGVRILQGVQIGDGAVIAAKALVNRDVPPYAIVAGIPAKIVRFRFEESLIRRYREAQWWNIALHKLEAYSQFASNPNEFISRIENEISGILIVPPAGN